MDFIETFLAYTEGLPSPQIFRLWSGIAALAAAAERRIWIKTSKDKLYPHLYTLLVSSPGIGKSNAIEKCRGLLHATKKIYLAADGTSKAALLDQLVEANRKLVIDGGKDLLEYHSLMVAADEFGTLCPAYDMEFLSVLSAIYDGRSNYRDVKRTTKSVDICNPQVNILAGSQPGFLSAMIPEEAWSQGFMSRMVLIYAGSGPKVDFFDPISDDKILHKDLVQHLTKLTSTLGEIEITTEAKAEARNWLNSDMEPIPDHSKLTHYNTRRNLLFVRLMMISVLSRGEDMIVNLFDLNRARDWLLNAETFMPDVFREMVQKNDSQTIQELYMFMWSIWAADKKPIHESRLIHFLSNRVTHEKVLKLLELAERSNIINKVAGTNTYTPRPRHQHGVE